ncbi:MAG TPA: HNH endonuclease [Longimicrobium sp.]|jgi:putative restriction endonuclease
MRPHDAATAGKSLVHDRLSQYGFDVEPGRSRDPLRVSTGAANPVHVLVRTKSEPMPGGGNGPSAIDWWIPERTEAEWVALAELTSGRVWLFRTREIPDLAQQHPAGSYHLYMYTEPIRSSKERVLDTHFEEYQMERRLDDLRASIALARAPLPAADSAQPRESRLAHLELASRTWDVLVGLARDQEVIEYAPLGDLVGQRFALAVRHPLDLIYRQCERRELPPLSVLVVNKGTGLPGPGFALASRDEFAALCNEVFRFDWQLAPNPYEFSTTRVRGTDPVTRLLESPDEAEDVYRLVKDRGAGQVLFREVILKIYSGRCAFSGSAILRALEAAHIVPWSSANPRTRLDMRNGILLTAWHHRLFDHGILTVDDQYRIRVQPGITIRADVDRLALDRLNGRMMKLPKNRAHRPDPALIRRRNAMLSWARHLK